MIIITISNSLEPMIQSNTIIMCNIIKKGNNNNNQKLPLLCNCKEYKTLIITINSNNHIYLKDLIPVTV